MPRLKTQADELYNIKRRLNRAAQRAEKAGNIALSRSLQDEARRYRKGRELSKREAATLIAQGEKRTSNISVARSTAARRNRIFKQQIESAGGLFSRFSENERTIFWKSTAQIWVGHEDDRYKAVLDSFYKGDNQYSRDYMQWLLDNGYDPMQKDLYPLMEYITSRPENVQALESAQPGDGTPESFRKLVTFG